MRGLRKMKCNKKNERNLPLKKKKEQTKNNSVFHSRKFKIS